MQKYQTWVGEIVGHPDADIGGSEVEIYLASDIKELAKRCLPLLCDCHGEKVKAFTEVESLRKELEALSQANPLWGPMP